MTLLIGVCFGKCPSPYVPTKNLSCVCPSNGFLTPSGNCELCHEKCKTCTTLMSRCTSCPKKTYLYNNTCVAKCPKDLFGDDDAGLCKGK